MENLNLEQKMIFEEAMRWIRQGRQFTKEQDKAYRAEMEFCEFSQNWTPSDSYERNLFDAIEEVDLPEEARRSIWASIEREGRKL